MTCLRSILLKHTACQCCYTVVKYGGPDQSILIRSVDVSWNNAFRKIFNACWRESVKPLQFYCSCLPASILVHQRRILFWLKMVRSDNVILHTLAGCFRDSVIAVLDKYSPTDSHCEPSMLSSCVVKRWFWLYFSNLCQAV